MRIMAVTMAFLSIMLLSSSANALERFAGLADGSDENLKAVCQDYMVNSFLKNDPELFFHLLPKSLTSREERLEKKWYEGHLKRFGSEKLTEYDVFEMEDEFTEKLYKGHNIKRIRIKYKAGAMEKVRRSSCGFEQFEDNRWYLAQKP
ncbi:hypothetical protein Q4591_18005 [Shewanella sp. 3_MG-2023]|uniref:hypothetical protein n=1 Tax=Shewanella sp. 3_MG-2023 TaxID=3062635 RepID=UPI0026E1B16A|nr:hypothetical protein [Shewanella sp. 3_MG-2023]MDO6777243.1 hypothetical protein [Shewanella sp. 3_MG-2023]